LAKKVLAFSKSSGVSMPIPVKEVETIFIFTVLDFAFQFLKGSIETHLVQQSDDRQQIN
jgi:hypothetical protein